MSFEVLLATCKQDNIKKLLDKMNIDSDIIVSNQTSDCSYEEFSYKNSKVKVYNLNSVGVGLNRNNALMNANADIVLLADDDVIYEDNYKMLIINEFKKHPEADMIIFNMSNKHKKTKRKHVNKWTRVRKYNCLKYGTTKIAFKLNIIKEKNIYFSLLFGGGARYSCGEDSLFILESLRKGIKIYASPLNIGVIGEGQSSWFRGYNEKFFFDKGYFHKVAFRKFAKLMNIQFLIRHKRIVCNDIKFFKAYRLMNNGTKENQKSK